MPKAQKIIMSILTNWAGRNSSREREKHHWLGERFLKTPWADSVPLGLIVRIFGPIEAKAGDTLDKSVRSCYRQSITAWVSHQIDRTRQSSNAAKG